MVIIDEGEVAKLLEIARVGDYRKYGIKNPKYIKDNVGTRYLIQCYYNFVRLALSSGMRLGELRGLKWSRVDFDNKFVVVDMQLVSTADYSDIFDEVKSFTSRRKISLDGDIMDCLYRYKLYQEKYADILGDKYDNYENLVFTNILGGAISASNFRNRYFNRMIAMAGISKGFTIHCMRHTHATLLLKNGVNLNVVSERLGHSKPSVTLDIYAHVLKSMETTASDMWSKIIKYEE